MGKRTAVWPYNGTLFNDKRKQAIKAQTDMEELIALCQVEEASGVRLHTI